jgi:ATP-dependent Clp protease protease subunit
VSGILPEQQMMGAPEQTDRIIQLSGDIDERSIALVTAQMFAMAGHDSSKPIHLIVSTYGGIVDEMFGLYDSMQFLPCPVYTIGLGKIMSAGVLILAAGEKGHRQIGENARVMVHPVRGGAMGNVFELMNEMEAMKRVQSRMVELLLQNTNITKKKMDQLMNSGHDMYLTADQAVELGIVDKVVKKFEK